MQPIGYERPAENPEAFVFRAPRDWLIRAIRLTQRAGEVAVWLLFWRGLQRRDIAEVSTRASFGRLHRNTVSKCLRKLEEMGMVRVFRVRGRRLRVEIVNVSFVEDASPRTS